MKTTQPRKQRKKLYNAPLHKKRKWIASHLTENLLLKYDKRSIPVIKGDTVKVMRGSYRGHEDKVIDVDVRKGFIQIEGLTLIKADGKKIAKPIRPSNLLITKLNLTDKWRRSKLERGLTEDVKKEIEQEAQQQLQEQQREKQDKEVEEPPTEPEKTPAEKTTESPSKTPSKPAKKPEDKTPKKQETPKKQPTAKTTQKKTSSPKKPAAKKETKKKPTKKKPTTKKKKAASKTKTSAKKKEEKT